MPRGPSAAAPSLGAWQLDLFGKLRFYYDWVLGTDLLSPDLLDEPQGRPIATLKTIWTLCGPLAIALWALGAATPANAADPLKPGDKITIRYRSEVARAEVLIVARDSLMLLIRLDSIINGRSGVVQVVGDAASYRFITGEPVTITK